MITNDQYRAVSAYIIKPRLAFWHISNYRRSRKINNKTSSKLLTRKTTC